MIVAKTPLRLTLGGGGSDLPGFYEKHGGFWITAAIDKYVYVLVKDHFESNIRVSYSQLEFASRPDEIQHGVIREALKMFAINSNFEVSSIADVPSGTGLGSSGSFTVALLGALNRYADKVDRMLPETAYRLEQENLNRLTGRQDHYAAYFGGCRAYKLSKNGTIDYEHINLDGLPNHLSLFYTETTRNSNHLLDKVRDAEETMLEIKRIGHESYCALKNQDYGHFGELMHQHWMLKRSISDEMSKGYIDKCYDHALKHGAIGGKLVGAGGGGFMLLVSADEKGQCKLLHELSAFLRYVPFGFTQTGLEVREV